MTMELPYIAGKTIKTTLTYGWGFNIDKVCILFTDGTSLILTPDQGYIIARLETPAAGPVITGTTRWPGE